MTIQLFVYVEIFFISFKLLTCRICFKRRDRIVKEKGELLGYLQLSNFIFNKKFTVHSCLFMIYAFLASFAA